MKRLSLHGVRHALVVAPHPDDEAIGAFGVIRALRRRGARVSVIVVADGAGSHRDSARWPTPRLVAERRHETRRAMRRIGVDARDIAFLGLPDGALGHCARHRFALAAAVRRRAPIHLLIGPGLDDDHPDHRFVATTLAAVPLSTTRRLSYVVWPRRGGKPVRPHVRFPADRAFKRATILRYRTQCGAIRDDPHGFSIAPGELRAFIRPGELFRNGSL